MQPQEVLLTRVLVAGARDPAFELALTRAGCKVVGWEPDESCLEARVQAQAPDAVVIRADSPARDTLEHLAVMNRRSPRPVVMLCGQGDNGAARAAAAAGVSLYVVDGVSAPVVRSLLDMAQQHFADRQRLQQELAQAKQALEDRRCVDQAKCALMEREGLGEAQAYHRLRRLAMQRGARLPDLARELLARL